MKVLGIGNALVDILTNLDSDAYFEEMGLIKEGMKLINEKELIKITSIIEKMDSKIASGGSSSNTISGLSRMNIECGFIGKVGYDSYGDFYRDDLINNGVKPFLEESDLPSGCALCMITPNGERTMGTYLGAASTLHSNDLQESVFSQYDLLHAEGYLVQDNNLILSAFKMAKNAGLKISLDLASFNIINEDKDFFKMLVKDYVDIAFANEEEAFAYTSTNDPLQALDMLSKDCGIAVVKVGAHGSFVKKGDEVFEAKAIKADCVDTTGAGDLYAAGFIFGLSKNFNLGKCAQIGSILSGNVVEVVGTKMDDNRWNKIKETIKKEHLD
ncbi:MAG: adenosine kinase [Bacteroidales bacterium]|nr:adenosine kinase [Bacteroidales bacterium]